MSALDYLFMIGGPIAFLLFALLGIYWVLGPGPPPNPVKLIRDGAVTTGMTRKQVLDAVGLPKSEVTNPDGTVTWRFSHGAEEAFVEDDAYVDFGGSGTVINVTVERTHVPSPEAAASQAK
jgi:hypothetical protein